MPKYANIPLLLIFWVSPGLSESHFAEKVFRIKCKFIFSLLLKFLFYGRIPLLSIYQLYIWMYLLIHLILKKLPAVFKKEWFGSLTTQLYRPQWTTIYYPVLYHYFLTTLDCENLSKSYEWAIRKLGSLVSKQEVCKFFFRNLKSNTNQIWYHSYILFWELRWPNFTIALWNELLKYLPIRHVFN